MNFVDRIKSKAVCTAGEVFERVRHRPFFGKDRILRAYSKDGLKWKKDNSYVFRPNWFGLEHMDYFTTTDERGRRWYRSSVMDPVHERYFTRLVCENVQLDLRDFGIAQLFSPCWVGDKLFAVCINGNRFEVRKFHPISWTSERTEWDLDDGMEDLNIIQSSSQYYGFRSSSKKKEKQIHIWTSSDLIRWQYVKPVFDYPIYLLANNPSVVRMGEIWRMYFRAGQREALGNAIYSAWSRDLISWALEPGTRLIPGDIWDKHGVGFPNVTWNGRWEMYYTGYWGECARGDVIQKYWEFNL